MSVRLSLKISVTIEPIGFYSSGNIPTGPVVVLGYFLGGLDTPNPDVVTNNCNLQKRELCVWSLGVYINLSAIVLSL